MESRIAKAIVVVKQMLDDRGVGLGELENIGDKELQALSTQLDFFHLAAADRDIVVITRKLKNQDLQKAAAVLDASRRDKTIIIVTEKPATFNIRSVQTNYGMNAEIFALAELQFNVSRHHLVPKHAKMTDVEVKSLMETYMLPSKSCLPSISVADPMAKYLGIRIGEVVRISRPSQSSGATFFYRHCIAIRGAA